MSRLEVRKLARQVTGDRRQLALLIVATIAVAVGGLIVFRQEEERLELRTCLAYGRSTPGPLAKFLADEARKRGLTLNFIRATGSEATIDALKRGELDVALVRSGTAREEPEIRQVATASCEALHVFARGNITAATPDQLRGRRIALGRPGSETRMFSQSVLNFLRLQPGRDFEVVDLQAEECTRLPAAELPDVVFDVAPLPSPRGDILAGERGYHLVEVPLGDALRLRDHAFQDIVIPRHTYSAAPPVPDRDLHTVGCQVVVVGRHDVSAAAVKRLLTIVFESDFARRAGFPHLDSARLTDTLDCPLHAGTIAYLDRHRPLIRAEMLENLEGLQGIIGTSTCGLLLAWGWYRRMRIPGASRYPQMLAELELDAIRQAGERGLATTELRQYWAKLARLRADVLGHVAARRLDADEKLSELLGRFAMVEQTLERLSERHLFQADDPVRERRAA
ncbi:MAG: hypothetical protein JNG90_08065 [Planctomycetaceae bacterium]|nr:hypothetical protein [Planctomycetaceae bacterium]